jgi:hypothetical protein
MECSIIAFGGTGEGVKTKGKRQNFCSQAIYCELLEAVAYLAHCQAYNTYSLNL